MFLVDTNIILEILLTQEKKDICKEFLNSNIGNLYISDFSYHSIGVILFRQKKQEIFKKFIKEFIEHIEIISLPKSEFTRLIEASDKYMLDFDDAYQFAISELFNLEIVTMDKDFLRVENIKINFI